MSDVRLVLDVARCEQRSFWRRPASAVFTVAFPTVLLVFFASLNRGATLPGPGGGSYNRFYVPAIVAYAIQGACFNDLAIAMVARRQSGLLKRLKLTPVPGWALLLGSVASALVVSTVMAAAAFLIGALVFDTGAPGDPVALVTSLMVGSVCFAALGFAISSALPDADVAAPIITMTYLGLNFLAGVFFPLDPDGALARVSGFLPTRRFVLATFESATDSGFPTVHLLVMAAWGAAAVVVAARAFRWEPKRT